MCLSPSRKNKYMKLLIIRIGEGGLKPPLGKPGVQPISSRPRYDRFGTSPANKNSLLDGLNIQKRELSVKGILAHHLGFGLGAFQRGFGGAGSCLEISHP